jgi:uncharacterized protein (TIGR03437 family)
MTSKLFRPPYLILPVLISLVFGFLAEPLAAADLAKMDPPAKVTWIPRARLTEGDFVDGVAMIEFTSNKDVSEVSIVATPSLTGFLTVEPAVIMDVVANTPYKITVTLLNPEEPLEHTLGGTIKVKEGNRTLAKPCSVSIKAEREEDPDGEGDGEGEGEENGDDDDDGVNTLTWTPEVIDESLFGEGDETKISFTSLKEIDKVCVWITPSAQDFLTAVPMMISDILADGTEYEIMLTLSPTLAELPRNVGGTLHIRQCDESGKMRRTCDRPIGIRISPSAVEEEPPADPEIVVSSADFSAGPIAPNEIVSVFGQGLGPEDLQEFSAKSMTVDTILAETQVLFDGIAAPLLATQDGQVNAIVPAGIAGEADAVMRVLHNGNVSAPFVVAVAETSPALYALDGSGAGPGAILNSDFTVNSRANRAAPGTWVALYGTGGGLGTTSAEDGTVLAESIPLAVPAEVTINRVPAEVLWAGYPAGLVQGVVQVNVVVPVDPRVVFGEWPVVLKVGNEQSGADITIAIE